jgi:propionyl-CoA carboxylase alpha chain
VKRNGWAIECRINAEDPFRSFLPSTGRLVRFQAPKETMWAAGMPSHGSSAANPASLSVIPASPSVIPAKAGIAGSPAATGMDAGDSRLRGNDGVAGGSAVAGGNDGIGGVRVDTGVAEGGEIPMYYDSMIAKLIVHGTDRNDAIAKMREALNGFVIRGISSNVPFQAALLAHPKFVAGDFNTGFIAEHYGQGFRAEDVAHDDPDFLVALAAYINRRSLQRSAGISGQMRGHEFRVGEDFVVVKMGADGASERQAAKVSDFRAVSGSSVVETNGKRYEICSTWHLGAARIRGTCNGQPFIAQVERGMPKNPLAIVVSHNGTRLTTMVFTPRTAELHALMPYKAPPDMSRFLLSPMPGLLVDVAVQPGQKVQAGERVAVIEAMKMENVLFAQADGVVGKVLAAKGESLAVDQPIVEFE